MQENNLSQFDILRSDCLTGLTDRLTGLVDLLICNPPYVETQEQEEGSDDIRASWAGGAVGRSLTDRVLSLLPRLLSKNGFSLIVLEQCNKPLDLMKEAGEKFDLKSSIVLQRRAGREFLSVVKFSRN